MSNVLRTKDYSILGTINSKERDIDIVDSNNEPVKNIIIDMKNTDTKTILVFCFAQDFTNEYYLLINGRITYVSNT